MRSEEFEMFDELVFVYGTLKSGFHNNYLLSREEYICKGETVEKYLLTEDGIPYVSDQIELSHIQGEVYKVSPDSLMDLDMLEGHPNWYERKQVKIKGNDDSVRVCWLYFNEKSLGSLINQDGDYGKENARRIPILLQQENQEKN
tara:strand:- start:2099 stop:2533 length:435 start_codon:yes stop_codon:yes gene_type:complete